MANEENSALAQQVKGFSLALEKVDEIVSGFFLILPNLIIGLVFFLFVLVLLRLVKYIVRNAGRLRNRPDLGNVLGSLFQWVFGTIGLLIMITIIVPGVNVADLITTLGITSVAIGFAFKDILENLLAGILILLRHPFRRGDQIVSGAFEGTVESIETRATMIRTYDGRRVLIPNSKIYTNSVVINTAFEMRRSQYDVGVGYDCDPDKAMAIILKAVREVDEVLASPPPQAFVSELAAWTVNIRVWWWTKPDQKCVLVTQGRVLQAIKEACEREGIDLPAPANAVLLHAS